MVDMDFSEIAGSNGKKIRVIFNPGFSWATAIHSDSASDYIQCCLYGEPPEKLPEMIHSVTVLSDNYLPEDRLINGVYRDGAFIPEN